MDGETAGDYSGNALAMSHDGTVVAIGAHGNDGAAYNAGQVRVYALDGPIGGAGSNWVQRGGDIDGAASNYLGRAVALSSDGAVLAVGIPNKNSQIGAVRVLVWNGVSWAPRGADIGGETSGDQSGWSVDISDDGTVVAIGAHRNDASGSNAGHVRIYRWYGGNWVQRGGDIDGQSSDDYSGFDVSCNSACSVVAVGAYGNDQAGSSAGHTRVYIFSTVLNSWVQRGSDINGLVAGDMSGRAIALDSNGNTLVIGATSYQGSAAGVILPQSGLVRAYTWVSASSEWVQRGADIIGEVGFAWNGASVAVNSDGTAIAMGATRSTDGNGVSTGQVRVFTWESSTSSWVISGVPLYGAAASDFFGQAVALSSDGKVVCVGAYYSDTTGVNAGSVTVYALP